MINVTRPFLPPRARFDELMDEVWERNWLTNSGPLVNRLELRLKDYLALDHLLFVANGTMALQLAIKSLGWRGEVITTPFTYIATSSSLLWEGCEPVYVDIDLDTFNIAPGQIEAAVTDKTCGIMATHVFGNPCETEKIEAIAAKHDLSIIYDAAHCFGLRCKSYNIFEQGDISTTSFHATKLFHTVEGGAVATTNPDLLKEIALRMNFGHDGPTRFSAVGINAKNSEFHAAMGLANLECIEEILGSRRNASLYYDQRLAGRLKKQQLDDSVLEYNYAYYPVLFDSEAELKLCVDALNANRVFPRRYFYPSLDKIGLSGDQNRDLPNSQSIASRILCLPLYAGISESDIDMICRIIQRALNYS